MDSRSRIDVPDERLAAFCRAHHIRKLALFGSVLRDDFRPDSDVDVLVEFESGQKIGLIGLAALEREPSEIFGRNVDLRTPAELSRYFRDGVVAHSDVRYATRGSLSPYPLSQPRERGLTRISVPDFAGRCAAPSPGDRARSGAPSPLSRALGEGAGGEGTRSRRYNPPPPPRHHTD